MAVISGILLILAFPPFDFYPLAWIALIPLLIALWGKNIKTSFYLGLLTGFVYFIGTVYWVSHSMYVYGGLPVILCLLLVILLSLYLACYVGTFAMFFTYLSRNSKLPALLLVPVLWVTLEFLRTYALTGFPWSILGYSQYKLLHVIQIADITGIYGISFLVSALNGALFDVSVYWPKRSGAMPLFGRLPLTLGILVYAIIIAFSIYYSGERLAGNDRGQTVHVSVVQGNIEQDKKWDTRFQREVIDKYKGLTVNAVTDSTDLIVWPETALPFAFGYDEVLTEEISSFQKQLDSHLLFGSILVKGDGTNEKLMSNSVVLLSPEGKIVSVYDKIHLVPYGEYVPLKTIFPFIKKLTVGIGNFMPGKGPVVMETPFARIGNLICYEIIFPGLVRKFVDKGANVLVTVTNDAWFGRTSAPYQHFSMAVFRAIENRSPVVRAANTGISGFIDSSGRIINKSDIFVDEALTEEVRVGNEKSFYTRYGDMFALLCILTSVLMIINKLLNEGRTSF